MRNGMGREIVLLIFSIFFISFVSAGIEFNNPSLPQLTQDLFDDKPSSFYMPNNKSVFGNFSFNGGFLNGGASIIDGDGYFQTGFFLNLTSLNVTKQNLTINENLFIANRLGIGTSSADAILEIVGTVSDINTIFTRSSGGHQWGINLNNNDFQLVDITNNRNPFRIRDNAPTSSFEILENGMIGLGTSIPASKLSVNGGVSIGANFVTTAAPSQGLIVQGNVGIGTSSPSSLFETGISAQTNEVNLSNTLFVNSTSGRVGIGTSSPSVNLEIDGGSGDSIINLVATTTNVGRLRMLGSNIIVRSVVSTILEAPQGNLRFAAESTGDAVTIQATTGNVGIGTSSPDNNLHIKDATIDSKDILHLETGADNVGDFVGLTFKGAVGGVSPHAAIRMINGPAARDVRLGFFTTSTDGGITEQVSIDHVGKVGIGTTSPDTLLHVNGGQVRITGASAAQAQFDLHPNAGSAMDKWNILAAADGSSLTFNSKSSGDFVANLAILDTGNVGIGTTSPSSLFETGISAQTNEVNLSNTLFVNSTSGNVGIGTTTPESMFTIADSVAVAPIDDFTKYQILIHSTGTNPSRSYGMGTESGAMWFNSDSTYNFYRDGSIVDMTIKDGNVGIGTTSPSSKLHVVGDTTLNGSLKMENFELNNISTNGLWQGIPVFNSTNESVNQLLFVVEEGGVDSTTITPHFWIQNGNPGQASGITRSFMIVNELDQLQNNANLTSCQAFADITGEPLQIDCNSSITGADLLVGDDIQVFGDVWIKSTGGFWKFLSRTMQLEDELHENILFNEINTSIRGANFNLTSKKFQNLTVNINANETTFNFITQEIALNTGTNITPVLNIINYQGLGTPVLTTSSTDPTVSHTDVAKLLIGSNTAQVFLFDTDNSHNDKFVDLVYDRFDSDGADYLSGLNTESSASDINISVGIVKIRLDEESYENMVNSSLDFYFINSSGDFEILTNIDNFDVYNTGETISNNKYFNVVFGVVPINQTHMRMVAVMSNKPSVEYNSLVSAEADSFDSTNFFPPNDEIRKSFVPVARTIIKKVAGTDTFQLLPDGLFHFDIRGKVTSSSGSPASPPITDHSLLDNLAFAVSGHTGFLSDFGDTATGNYTFDSSTLFIDSVRGRIGIGTTNPQNLLNVDGDINATNNIFVGNNVTLDSGAKFWSNATCAFISSPDGSTTLEVCNA
jgi:hypothetical protein